MIFLTVSVLALSFPGCGKKENTSDRTLRVGIVTYTQDDPFINTMTEQIREDLKLKESKDMKILVSVKNGDNDQRDQDELVEEMIAAGCDVLCVNLVDRTAPSDIIKAARQEKIPVIFFNREPVKEVGSTVLCRVRCKAVGRNAGRNCSRLSESSSGSR